MYLIRLLSLLTIILPTGSFAFYRTPENPQTAQHLGFELRGFKQEITTEKDTVDGYNTFTEKFAKGVLLSWDLPAGEHDWWPYFKFGMNWVSEIPARNQVNQISNKLVVMGLGGKYLLNSHWLLFGEISLEQEHFLNHLFPTNGDPAYQELSRVNLPKIRLGGEALLWRHKKLDIEAKSYLLTYLPKKKGELKVQRGIGYGLNLGGEYWHNPKYQLSSHLWYEWMQNKVKSPVFANKSSRYVLGLNVSVGYFF